MGPRFKAASRLALGEALAVSIEHIPYASFVITAQGSIALANRSGSAWLAVDRAHILLLRPPDPSRFRLSAFIAGGARFCLASLRPHDVAVPRRITHWGLTTRELQVTEYVLQGLTNRQIAEQLDCALKTVEHHVSRALAKANVENRASLILAAM